MSPGLLLSFQPDIIGVPEELSFRLQNWGDQLWGWKTGYLAGHSRLALSLGLSGDASILDILSHLYRAHGPQAALQLNGSLTWVIWDANRCLLTAVTDRLGIYRFYYSTSKGFTISDSLSNLLEHLKLRPDLNLSALISHMVLDAPPIGETYYHGIHALEPGSWLQFTTGELSSGRYWAPTYQPTLHLSNDLEYDEAYRNLLFEVIDDHHIDEPSAVCISSGLDSNAVAVGLTSTAPSLSLHGITFIAPEFPEADEGHLSALVAQKLKLPLLTVPAKDFLPFSSAEGIGTSRHSPLIGYFKEIWGGIYNLLRRHDISTLFTGLGGDHLFGGGVFSYSDLLLTGHWWELVKQIRRHLPLSHLGFRGILRRLIYRPLLEAYGPARTGYLNLVPWLRPEAADLYRGISRSKPSLQADPQHYFALPGRKKRLKILQDRFLPLTLEQDLLESTAYGIEQRHPLLDYRLIEFALSLPATQFFEAGYGKMIVRRALKDYLPEPVIMLRNKIHPSQIFHTGIRENEKAVQALCSNMRLSELGLIDETRFYDAVCSYISGQTDSILFWYTLSLEDWLRRWN